MPLTEQILQLLPTSAALKNLLSGNWPVNAIVDAANQLAKEKRFFHWPLEFPEVYKQGGFDCVLGNPPWERVQPEVVQFFSKSHPELLEMNRGDRENSIRQLDIDDPETYEKWMDMRRHNLSTTKFLKSSGIYPLSTSKNINSYALFQELALYTIKSDGRSGMILQSGIVTDDINKDLFRVIMTNYQLDLIGNRSLK